ncbi:hypothetical protein [Rahnella aceris]
MKAPIECDEGILSLLLPTEKTHIDYLVDVLTDGSRGRLALSSSVKDLLLMEKAGTDPYSEEILRQLLHEFQTYGGHSIANMFRKAPLPYKTILRDVHTKLRGVGTESKTDLKLEQEIVTGLFGSEWKDMPEHTRLDRSTEMNVVSGLFNLGKIVEPKETARNFGAKIFSNVASIAQTYANLSPILSIGEAYRVTIPFVAQLAYIKMLTA